MSKAVMLDHEFDIDKFSELLKKAQGPRTQTEFANACGLSVAYICKHINKKLDKAPIPSTIKKIAACAANGVTYSELLEAAGYNSNAFSPTTQPDCVPSPDILYIRRSIATITAALSKCSFSWSSLVHTSRIDHDFGIAINEGCIENWYFEFVNIVKLDGLRDLLKSVYWNTITNLHSPHTKLSFVTDNLNTYNSIKSYVPYMIAMYVSVVLIDTTTLSIIKEEYLYSALPIQSDLEKIYKLEAQE